MKRIDQIIAKLQFGSNKPSQFTKEKICNSFKQGRVDLPLLMRIGGGGNCASVALIKAAIGTFGFDNIFKSIVIDNQNKRYLIDLKDDDSMVYSLSFNDYEYGATKSAFEPYESDEISKDIFEFAKFCFAVLAEVKRCDYRVNKRYARAINDLNKGEETKYIHEYLGLNADTVKDISIKNLSSLKNLVAWNGPHAVYSSEGVYDEFFEEHNKEKLAPIQPLSMLKIIHGNGTSKDDPIGAYKLV